MDPYREQRLREEVIYLHSLWHQGPPLSYSSSSNPNYNPIPISIPNPNKNIIPILQNQPISTPHISLISNPLIPKTNTTTTTTKKPNMTRLKPFDPTHKTRLKAFKMKMKKQKPKKLPPSSEFQWPCNDSVADQPSTSSGWPIFKPAKTKPMRLLTVEEQTLLDGIQLQQKALNQCKQFFTENEDGDGCIDSDEDSDDDDDDTMDEDGDSQYNFFVKVFEEDGELRGYYEKNNRNGEFSCLVCGGIGERVGKRFKHCVSLVQHSLTIAKTKKKKAHRAYSHVVCKVLGWDINKLPSAPLPSDKNSDDSKGNDMVVTDNLTNNNKDPALGNVGVTNSETSSGDNVMPSEGNPNVAVRNISIGSMDTDLINVENRSNLEESDVGRFPDAGNCSIPGITDNLNGAMMLCESSVKVEDAENIECETPNTGRNSSGVVNHLSSDVARMTMLEGK